MQGCCVTMLQYMNRPHFSVIKVDNPIPTATCLQRALLIAVDVCWIGQGSSLHWKFTPWSLGLVGCDNVISVQQIGKVEH
jgi:hypothetical protein